MLIKILLQKAKISISLFLRNYFIICNQCCGVEKFSALIPVYSLPIMIIIIIDLTIFIIGLVSFIVKV